MNYTTRLRLKKQARHGGLWPVILVLGRWRKASQKFKVSLAYTWNLIPESLFQNITAAEETTT